jgi:uncharacterized protein
MKSNKMCIKVVCSCPRHSQGRREFIRLGLGSLALLSTSASWADVLADLPAQPTPKYYGAFRDLPIGAVKPAGWIKGWLQRQADGLTGHPENLAYPYDTCMYAGIIPPPTIPHGQNWWPYEQSGYFVDGATRLGHLIDNPAAQKIPAASLQYILDNSGPGKLGESTWGWPNTVVGRALIAEHSATGNTKIADVLSECVLGSRSFGGRDGYIFEEALYLYGLNGDPRLLGIAQTGYNRYFLDDTRSFSHVDKIHGDKPLREHGVTAAEQLKLLPMLYCYTGDAQAKELAGLAYRKIEDDSLMPDGGIVSSESLGTTVFDSMHETCDLTDWSWSFGYQLMASGEGHWADLIERIAFNALPGAVTKDFKQLQYFSSVNQILASNTACPRIAPTRMSYRSAHDTECCAGNVNRAMPNYVTRMWMRMAGGVAATLYGPCELNTVINGQPVVITEETDYPFRETLTFKVKIAQPTAFAFALRIPEWCSNAALMINGKPAGLECRPGTFVTLQREYRDGDRVELQLPMGVQLKDWFGGRAVSVQRGPLVYSVKIDENWVESQQDPDAIKRALKGNNIQGFPAVEFFPQGEWRYGMDPAQKSAPEKFKVIEAPMPENPFLAESAPVRIEVPLRILPQWATSWRPVIEPASSNLKLAPHNPSSLPDDAEMQAVGEPTVLSLVPYGSTYLRLTTLPVIKNATTPPASA